MKLRSIFTESLINDSTKSLHTHTVLEDSVHDDMDFGILECVNVMNEDMLEIQQESLFSIYTASIGTSRTCNTRERIVTEGFKDLLKSSGNVITKLINKIKEIFQRINMWLTGRLGSFSRFIEKNKDKLTDFKGSFKTNLIEYDIIQEIPQLSVVRELISRYNSELHSLSEKSLDDFKASIINADRETELDVIRGRVLGQGPITSSDFPKEIEDVFKKGNVSGVDIDIDANHVRVIMESYKNLAKYKSTFDKERVRTIRYLNDLKAFFDRGVNISKLDGSLTANARSIKVDEDNFRTEDASFETRSDSIEKISMFYTSKLTEARELSSIVLLALNGKTTAIQENLKQFEKIIRTAASMYRKGGD